MKNPRTTFETVSTQPIRTSSPRWLPVQQLDQGAKMRLPPSDRVQSDLGPRTTFQTVSTQPIRPSLSRSLQAKDFEFDVATKVNDGREIRSSLGFLEPQPRCQRIRNPRCLLLSVFAVGLVLVAVFLRISFSDGLENPNCLVDLSK